MPIVLCHQVWVFFYVAVDNLNSVPSWSARILQSLLSMLLPPIKPCLLTPGGHQEAQLVCGGDPCSRELG